MAVALRVEQKVVLDEGYEGKCSNSVYRQGYLQT